MINFKCICKARCGIGEPAAKAGEAGMCWGQAGDGRVIGHLEYTRARKGKVLRNNGKQNVGWRRGLARWTCTEGVAETQGIRAHEFYRLVENLSGQWIL